MLNHFFKQAVNANQYRKTFLVHLLIANTASLLVYGLLRIIISYYPFEVTDEIFKLLNPFSMASGFAFYISLLLIAAYAAEYCIQSRNDTSVPACLQPISISFFAAVMLLSACSTPVSVGIKKDFNTGLSSSYTGMEPEKVMLVMNNEVLNHTDIPLGESFLLVNDGIKGIQVKNGKVVVGCALKITDQKGNVLMEEKDLFAGRDTFEEKDAKMLQCTVSTGKPMEWDEKYQVAVTFWDKNGTGKIENDVTIRCIDIPQEIIKQHVFLQVDAVSVCCQIKATIPVSIPPDISKLSVLFFAFYSTQ